MTDYTDPRYLASRLLIDYENPRPRYQDADIQATINYLQRCPTPAQISALEARVKELEFAEAELKYRKMLTSPTPAQIEAAREALQDATEASGCDTFNAAPCGICIPCKARAALDGLEGR